MDFEKRGESGVFKGASIVFTLSVILLLLFLGPAQALTMSLTTPEDVVQGQSTSFIAQLTIQSDDQYIDVQNFTLNISGPSSQICVFDLEGDSISGCAGLTISKLSSNSNYSYGYGYGYGYSYTNAGQNNFTYNVTVNTSLFDTGAYNVTFTTPVYYGYEDTSFTITAADSANPVVTLISPPNDTESYATSLAFEYTVLDDSSVNCSFSLSGPSANTTNFLNMQANGSIISTSSLEVSNGTYAWNVSCTDAFGNVENSETRSLEILLSETIVEEQIDEVAYEVNSTSTENATEIILVVTPSVIPQSITIPANVSDSTEVMLDLSQVFDTGTTNITLTNDLNLTRLSNQSQNYSVEISSGTVIVGPAGWDGKIELPIIETGYSVSGGDMQVAIKLGSNVSLNFTKAVKITLGGMAGKKAGWAVTGTTLTTIDTICNDTVDPGNINTVSPRECYLDNVNDVDLDVWTYHFTIFGAYTPSVVSSPSSSASSGCITTWKCSDWSVCSAGNQTRTCAPEISYCYAPAKDKPAETQTCTVSETIASTETGITTPTGETKIGEKIAAISAFAWISVIAVLAIIVVAYLLMRKPATRHPHHAAHHAHHTAHHPHHAANPSHHK